jgi:hypothetical protein
MPPAGQLQLDWEYLSKQAQLVASEVATEKQLYVAPEALSGVDFMVDESQDRISKSWRNLDTWKKHVRHVSTAVANLYIARKVRRITDSAELVETARPVYKVYPYD